jgi:hypothetical protein
VVDACVVTHTVNVIGPRAGAVGGGEIISLNCCKWLQINRLFFQAVTARLRSETTLPIKWIAARVQIGTAKGAKSVLHHLAQSQDLRKTIAPSNHAPNSNSNLRFDPERWSGTMGTTDPASAHHLERGRNGTVSCQVEGKPPLQ